MKDENHKQGNQYDYIREKNERRGMNKHDAQVAAVKEWNNAVINKGAKFDRPTAAVSIGVCPRQGWCKNADVKCDVCLRYSEYEKKS